MSGGDSWIIGSLPRAAARAIAKRLGVGQASLYNHISSRDELLDSLNARVLAGVDLSALDHPDWTEAVYRGTLAFLAALQRHPNMMGALATRPARTDPSLTYYERMHERLRSAGLSAQDSVGLQGSPAPSST